MILNWLMGQAASLGVSLFGNSRTRQDDSHRAKVNDTYRKTQAAKKKQQQSGTTGDSSTSDGSGGGGSGGSGGSGGGDGSTGSTDGTTENVKRNDPAKNKQLGEIRISEELRDSYKLVIKIPKILKGLHTNQFFFMDVTDEFYEKNYPTMMKLIANKKFGRYAGFEKGRFFVDKIVEKGGISGVSMELTLNPIATNYGQYIKLQQEAEKALIEALNDETKYEGTSGSGSGGGISSTTRAEIYAKAQTWEYKQYGNCSSSDPKTAYEWTEAHKCCDCFGSSASLYYQFSTFTNIPCRIVVGKGTGKSGTHRSVQLKENGKWIDPPEASKMTMKLRPTPRDKTRHLYGNFTTEP